MNEKRLLVLSDAKASQWCYVDADNEFTFMGNVFAIDESVEEYKVYNKARQVKEYTNESYMEKVLVVFDKNSKLKFYNQVFDSIEDSEIIVRNN